MNENSFCVFILRALMAGCSFLLIDLIRIVLATTNMGLNKKMKLKVKIIKKNSNMKLKL